MFPSTMLGKDDHLSRQEGEKGGKGRRSEGVWAGESCMSEVMLTPFAAGAAVILK